MKKRLLSVLVCVVMLVGLLPATITVNAAGLSNGVFEYSIINNTVRIDKYIATNSTGATVPDTLDDGYPVTEIGAGAFAGCTGLRIVVLPASIRTIGDGAFTGMSTAISFRYYGSYTDWDQMNIGSGNDSFTLSKIVFDWGEPFSYRIMDNKAQIYWTTDSVETLEIPETIAGFPVTEIVGYAFEDCHTIRTYKLPDSVTKIGYEAFGIASFDSIYLGSGLRYIDMDAFDGARLNDVYYNGSAEDWAKIEIESGNDALLNATFHFAVEEVKTVSVSGIVEPFRNRAPEYTVDASEQYTVENFYWYDLTDGYTIDGGYEFEDGHEYQVILDLKAKPGYRFDITNMKVSVNGVTGTSESLSGKPTTEWVRVRASFMCSGSSVSGTVGDCQYTFYYNTKLLRIYGGTKIYPTNFNIDTGKLDGEVIQYPWDTYYDQIESVVIGEGITDIGVERYGRAFEQCTNLRSLKLPNSLEQIGNMTFARCTSLQNISLPPNLYFIGESAFYGCTSLGNFTLPSGLLYIDMQAFYECTGLTHMTFPSSVRTIGANAFMNCVNLTEVTFPEDSIAAIESTAFESTGLSSVYLPSGVTFRGYFDRPSEKQFGYIFIKVGHHTKMSDFKIITDSKDAAAYTYAKENGFDVTVLIKNVDISGLAEPVINQTASTALVLSPENVYGADVQWRNETDGTYLSAGDKFRPGKVYAVYCTLYANDDYGFATNNGSSVVTASLNGKRPTVQTFNEIDPEDTIRLKLTFPKIDPNITSAQITGVREPSFEWGFYTSDFSLNNPGLEGYVQWYDVTGGDSTRITDFNRFVRYNRTYEARVYLSAKEDYVINADNFTATINGQNARIFTDNGKVVAAITFDTPPVPEEMRIDEIRFTNIDRPVVGAHPDYDFDADGNYTITGFKWINPDLNENSVFERNTIYRLQIEFEANEGYLFNTDDVYVDTAESYEGTSNIDYKNPDKYRKTVIVFPATESYEVLHELGFTDISAPVLSGDVNFNFTPSEGFTVDNSKAFWYCNEDGRFLNAGEKFEAKQYSAIFEISAKDGYRFDNQFVFGNLLPTVNGNEADAQIISGRSEARFLRIRYDFPTLGETPVVNKKIRHVDITGVTLPLAGDVPVNEVFCSDEGVTIDDISWWDNAMGYWMEPGLTFEVGKEYRLRIEISADDYYEFYQNELTGVELVGTVNGKKAELQTVLGHDFGEKLVLNAYYVCQPNVNFAWSGDRCTVTLSSVGDDVIIRAASYRQDRLEEIVQFDADTASATLTGDTVKVFYWLKNLSPVHQVIISTKP